MMRFLPALRCSARPSRPQSLARAFRRAVTQPGSRAGETTAGGGGTLPGPRRPSQPKPCGGSGCWALPGRPPEPHIKPHAFLLRAAQADPFRPGDALDVARRSPRAPPPCLNNTRPPRHWPPRQPETRRTALMGLCRPPCPSRTFPAASAPALVPGTCRPKSLRVANATDNHRDRQWNMIRWSFLGRVVIALCS